MQTVTVEDLITMLTPMFSGIVCIVLLLLDSPVWSQLKGSGIRDTLLTYYLLIVFNWGVMVVYAFYPNRFTDLFAWVAFTMLLVPVVLYRFIFILTRTDSNERFSKLHYVLPVIVLGINLAWLFLAPEDASGRVSIENMHTTPGYEGFYILASLLLVFRLLFGIGYTLLGIRRYRLYRRLIINYSSDLYLSSLYWLRLFLILSVCFVIIPLLIMSAPLKELLGTYQLILVALILFVQHIILCFNVIRGNYVFVTDQQRLCDAAIPAADKEKQLKQETFSRYIEQQKPYLDPHLTIVDMADALHTNRSYLSAFINNTYKMNFSQFVNECRLQELDRIIANPHCLENTNIEKITSAGFGSYQSYHRAHRMHEERKRLKLS
ncbi:AraC-like DNA-binding protein [Parabacteroides sp. PFB2-10]|uniref:hypothetical protein n=1 Tax=Parabacteroides sp. PFB2-10 TaxID=1742405 RepID=UPI002476BFAB|nr:hypothetical protein [Parabacteroides sp. PFB2-10]MDH6312028.1 AraC-like DNA-binding protein [Parabacteroides sp. PFB2-10]